MTIYITISFITLFLGRVICNGENVYIDNKNNTRALIALSLLLIVWSIVYTFRGIYVGGDAQVYFAKYKLIYQNDIELTTYFSQYRDIGFALLQYLCLKLSDGNWFVFQFVLAIFTYFPVIYTIYKHSEDILSSLLLYIFTMVFFSGFNGTKQAIAVSIIFYGYYEGFLKKKWIWFIISSLIAFSFHSTVILVIPFLLLSKYRINSRPVWITICVLIFSFFVIWDLWIYILAFLEGIGQIKLAKDYASVDASARGSSLLRTIVSFSPVLIASFNKKFLFEHNKKNENEMIILIFASLFTMLSMRYWIFSRMASYFNIVSIMFIPSLVNLLPAKNIKIGKILVCFMYFLFMVILLLHGDGHFYPYYFWRENEI